jgi:hypothetical protein
MRMSSGLALFARGLFLKLCFADSFAVFTGYVMHAPEQIGAGAAWLGTLAYAMQIYFDFSGYSLMAIGLGAAFGFDFPDNFRRPYLAGSLQEFWRRWHISLSSWLRDYVYHSLGGNRGGRLATYRNLFLTMLLGGIWHGAGFNTRCGEHGTAPFSASNAPWGGTAARRRFLDGHAPSWSSQPAGCSLCRRCEAGSGHLAGDGIPAPGS